MAKWLMSLLIVSMMTLAVGCSSGESAPDKTPEQLAAEEAEARAQAERDAVPNPIPETSPFSKIKYGMSMEEVYSILGQPTSQGAYVTGKAWIPFYFGGDKTRSIARYKGQGYIIFSQNHSFTSSHSVQTIYYDPNERGFE